MMIETRGLCKSFGSHVVLDSIDLDVPSGTISALLGPNGAGKTTTLNGQTFLGVTFDLPALKDVSLQGETLKNVSFRPVGLWFMKRAIQSMHFDGAVMDKLTYAALKGLSADVSKVTVLS
jgi:ABC-type Fe3+/spermidine/putrescine transport system ATPase subunit